MKVILPKGAGMASIHCAACGVKDEFDIPRGTQMVDVYCKFTDKYYLTGQPQAPAEGRRVTRPANNADLCRFS